jgi:hypothetical protein
MKTSFIYLIFFIILVSDLKAQNKILSVPFISQRTDSWCWAACMESIVNYHNTNTTQCRLSIINLEEQNRFAQITNEQLSRAVRCCNNMCMRPNDCRFETSCVNCNVTISSINTFKIPFFQNIFSKLSFNSKEDTIDLSWEQVKSQIDNTKPFILALDMQLAPNSEEISHALIAKGYETKMTIRGIENKYIVCDNPWKYIVIESGREICKPYKRNLRVNHLIFQRATGLYHKVDSYVIDIQKSTIQSLQTSIQPRVMAQITKQEIDTLSGITENLNDKELDDLLKDDSYQKVNVRYISKINLDNNNLDNNTSKQNIIEIVNHKSNPKTVTSLQKVNNEWIPVEIYEKDINDRATINVNGKKICLKGFMCQEKSEPVNYELIKFYPYPYEFYRFIIDKKSYLSPVESYGDFTLKSGNRIFKNEAYRELKIIEAIKNTNLFRASSTILPVKDKPNPLKDKSNPVKD